MYENIQAYLVPAWGIAGAPVEVKYFPTNISEFWVEGFRFHHDRGHNNLNTMFVELITFKLCALACLTIFVL